MANMRRYFIVLLTVFAMMPAPGCSWYDALTHKLGMNSYSRSDPNRIPRAEAERLEAREPD
jgi:hypothetical protein